MAERRMFSKSIVNSARFLRMPQTSRLLYYDLGMAADDDGIVEAFTVIRTTGAAEDDLRVLASRGFVVVLNDDLVSYISNWAENNWIRAERKRPSIYRDLLVKVVGGNQLADKCLTDGNQLTAEDSIGKDSIDKVSQGKASQADLADKPPEGRSDSEEEFEKFWSAYPKQIKKQEAREAFAAVDVPVETLLHAIKTQLQQESWTKEGGRYVPAPAKWLNDRRWEDGERSTAENIQAAQWVAQAGKGPRKGSLPFETGHAINDSADNPQCSRPEVHDPSNDPTTKSSEKVDDGRIYERPTFPSDGSVDWDTYRKWELSFHTKGWYKP